MFVVDAAVLLPHTPHAVARVVGRLHLLPRWCAGLRRVRFPSPAPGGPAASVTADATDRTCVFTYAVTDVRLTLRARTRRAAPAAGDPPRAVAMPTAAPAVATPTAVAHAAVAHAAVTHTAAGDGLTLGWTFVAEPFDAPALPHAAPRVHTRLSARVEVHVDAAHPLAAARAALCRVVARRVPADLERLRTLIDRYDASRAPLPLPLAPLPSCSPPGISP
jgi:hypothetical protein